jgi:hypothetical protein
MGGIAMRRGAIWLLLAGMAMPAMAAKPMSVEQLEDLLTANQGKADAHVAGQLGDLELTERVSPERLAKWEKQFPGDKTREILLRMADEAAFLKTPAMDMMRINAPDQETQEHMVALAVEYVKTTMTRLPNFTATRATTHFEDAPAQEQVLGGGQGGSGWRPRAFGITMGKSEAKPLHIAGTYSATVTYRDGFEVRNEEAKSTSGNRPTGLATSGEFGPVLSVVIGDASRNQVTWGYWEKHEGDSVAVVRYEVPEDHSNYLVGIPNGTKVEQVYPGYHGEIAIDPATGSILRLSLVADLAGPYQSLQNAIEVEYAPVEIGDRTYICPVHSVAFSKVPVAGAATDAQNGTVEVQTQMNDVVFSDYHLFGSEARIVADGKTDKDGAGPSAATSTTGAADPSTGAAGR